MLETHNSDTQSKVSQLFEYLLAVMNLDRKVIRRLGEYEKVWWQTELPQGPGLYMHGSGTDEEAWLEVQKQEIPVAPPLPDYLTRWVTQWDDPDEEPTVVEHLLKENAEPRRVEAEAVESQLHLEFFTEDPERVDAYERWLSHTWRPWATVASAKTKIQQLYMEFFALHQRFQREGNEIELAYGHGLLSWATQGQLLERPFLVTRLELTFDAKKGIFYLHPTSKGTVMETEMLNNIEFPNAVRIQEMERQLEDLDDFDPRNPTMVSSLLREIAQTISPEGKYEEQMDAVGKRPAAPLITFTPALFLRKSGDQLWVHELTTAIEQIKEGFPVPATIAAMASLEQTESSGGSSSSAAGGWNAVGEELLFPLPSNNEQKLIAQKLAAHDGVVVQGPPGTGKSHTIVNLISHLLAHGKRVLVTSEKERALQALRDKIPDEIRALCVSVLGGDSRSVKEIEDSIRHIAEMLDTRQAETIEQTIKQLQTELYEARKNIARYQYQIDHAAEEENQTLRIDDQDLLPLDVAQWLTKNQAHNWLPDSLTLDRQPPLTDEEMNRFFSLLGQLAPADVAQVSQQRPQTKDLPAPAEFEKQVQHIHTLKERVENSAAHVQQWALPATMPDDVEIAAAHVKQVLHEWEHLQAAWLQTILQDAVEGGQKLAQWQEFVQDMRVRAEHIQALDKQLIEYELQLPAGVNEATAKEDLSALLQHVQEKKGFGWFFKNITGRKYAYLIDGCQVNSLPIRSAHDIEVLLQHLDHKESKKKLVLKWNRTMEEIVGEQLDPAMNRFALQVRDRIDRIDRALRWRAQNIEPLEQPLKTLGVPGVPQWADPAWWTRLDACLQALIDRKNWEAAHVFFANTSDLLARGQETHDAHPYWSALLQACRDQDVEVWESLYRELLRLESLETDTQLFLDLKRRLQEVAPNWVLQLVAQGGQGSALAPPDDWKTAWQWSQCHHALNELHQRTDLEAWEAALEREHKLESRLIKQLVAESTWLSQLRRTTGEQKRSLFAWLKAIQRIGKGTGKYANMYRKEAAHEMKTCRSAIPVWIMPIQKVIENIELSQDQFDVIIIDESSQSDLYSLSALLRARKAVIVGDDNQISPEVGFVNIADVHSLIDRYLVGLPNRKRFEPSTSLYDMASQVYDSKIVLKEHFRCVPEIIQFSNDLMYGGKIDPLRLPLAHEMLTPAVQSIRVVEGFRDPNTNRTLNYPEAEAIVEKIIACCADPAYQGRTMGVISLQGHDQAKLIESMLREQLGEEEMIDRRLLVGDAYSFQGDERDVIFLSMVAAANVRVGSLTKRSDYQRFNVAASRARDQMFLFHSIDTKDLNPNCARYLLLQYCQEPHRVQEAVERVQDLFESQFEEDVYKLIAARGYRVVPQVKVGSVGKRIDLVVEGMRNRLAVECDGDRWHGLDKWQEDMERQRVLERVGWTFWRVRGSVFYRDPAKALEPLWAKLQEMNIEPSTRTA